MLNISYPCPAVMGGISCGVTKMRLLEKHGGYSDNQALLGLSGDPSSSMLLTKWLDPMMKSICLPVRFTWLPSGHRFLNGYKEQIGCNGFGDIGIHSGCHAFIPVFFHIVGREGDNWDPVI